MNLEYKYENCMKSFMTTRPEDRNQYLQYSDWIILEYKYNKDLRGEQYDTSAACHVDKGKLSMCILKASVDTLFCCTHCILVICLILLF